MSAPPLPSPLDYVGLRRFCLYPPIAHPDPNLWLLGFGARSEVQVINVHTGRELWIPRQYIGAVSESDGALLVVGLTKALKLRNGNLEPQVKEVIQMPLGDQKQPELFPSQVRRPIRGASVVAIRLDPKPQSSLSRTFLNTCTAAIVVALLAALLAAAIHF